MVLISFLVDFLDLCFLGLCFLVLVHRKTAQNAIHILGGRGADICLALTR